MDDIEIKDGNVELAKWVGGDFRRMRDARKPLEDKWNANFDAYNNEDCGERKWKKGEGEGWRSKSYIGVTRQKIMAAYSLIMDMTLRGGRIPLMLKRQKGMEPMEAPPIVAEAQGGSTPDAPQMVSIPDKDLGITGMESLINSQLEVGAADVEYGKVAMSMCVFGEGWSKLGTRVVSRSSFGRTPDGWLMKRDDREIPAVEKISVWDVFRDLETDDLSKCAGIAHRQLVSAYELRSMLGRGEAGYQDDVIKAVLDDLPDGADSSDSETTVIPADMGLRDYFGGADYNRLSTARGLSPALRDVSNRRRNIEIVERWGRVPRKFVAAFESDVDVVDISGGEDDGDEIECVVTIACGKVIRYVRTTVDDRPFCRSVFEDALEGVGGVGLPDKIKHEQKVLNGSVRAFEDNARLAGDVMLAIKPRLLLDQDKIAIKPGGVIPLAEECMDARQAVQQITVQNVGAAYQNIIALIERYAEESSMIPRITQGASPIFNKTTTLGEINQQTDKAGKYLGTVIANIDNGTIEKWGRYFLRWNMEDPAVPDEIKGDYYVVALGFTSYEDKVLKFQRLQQLLTISANIPPLMSLLDFEKIAKSIAEIMDLDHEEVVKSQDRIMAEQQAADQARQADMMNQAMVAKTMAQAEKIKVDAKAKMDKTALDVERLKNDRARLVGDLEEMVHARNEGASEAG